MQYRFTGTGIEKRPLAVIHGRYVWHTISLQQTKLIIDNQIWKMEGAEAVRESVFTKKLIEAFS